MTCIILLIILALLGIVASMIIISYYAVGDFIPTLDKNVDYGPGDTQSLFFSTIFCEELVANEDTLYNADYKDSYLYLLSEPPSLSGKEEIVFGDSPLVFDQPHERNFHLFPGSKISVEACAEQSEYSGFGSFYLVQGKANYSDWEEEGRKVNQIKYVASMHLLNICNEDGMKKIEFTVTKEDQYYLLFVNDKISKQIAEISANFTIERNLYSFNESSIIKHCKFSTQSCSLKVPFQKSTSVLLAYGEPTDWEGKWSNKSIEVLCIPRVWFYTVLVALGVLLIVLATFFGCVTCWCCSHALFKANEAEKPLLGAHTGTLYSEAVEHQNEMSNPSKYVKDSKKDTSNYLVAPTSNSRRPRALAEPHPPPSFRRTSVEVGTPSCETFTKR